MEKEIQRILAFESLIRYFKEHIGYSNLTDADCTKFKEYVKNVVELSNQPYYNQLIEEYFSKLPPKEDNPSFNIYKAFEDKKKEIEAAQNEKPFKDKIKEADKMIIDNFKVKLNEESIIPYFIEYFKLSLLIYTNRVENLGFEDYRATRERYEFLNNLLAYNAKISISIIKI